MPAELTSIPLSNFAPIGVPPMLAQAPNTTVNTAAAKIFTMPFSC
jgi:hypothetical protein